MIEIFGIVLREIPFEVMMKKKQTHLVTRGGIRADQGYNFSSKMRYAENSGMESVSLSMLLDDNDVEEYYDKPDDTQNELGTDPLALSTLAAGVLKWIHRINKKNVTTGVCNVEVCSATTSASMSATTSATPSASAASTSSSSTAAGSTIKCGGVGNQRVQDVMKYWYRILNSLPIAWNEVMNIYQRRC